MTNWISGGLTDGMNEWRNLNEPIPYRRSSVNTSTEFKGLKGYDAILKMTGNSLRMFMTCKQSMFIIFRFGLVLSNISGL